MYLLCLGGLFSKTEMSEVLTEILKVDPSFDKDSFLKQCERDIIPNILEVCWTANSDTSFLRLNPEHLMRNVLFLSTLDLSGCS